MNTAELTQPFDVFLSYNHEDEETTGQATSMVEGLEAAGYSVWWDRHLLVGENWHAKLHQQMTSARRIVALISKRMLQSSYCEFELNTATALGKLVPVLLEPVEAEDYPKELAQTVPALNRVMFDDTGAMDKVVEAIGVLPSQEDSHRSAYQLLEGSRISLPAVLTSGAGKIAGRAREEALMMKAWESCADGADPLEKTNVLVLHAIGGAGKTALLRLLVDRLVETGFAGADRVIGWSAFSQGSGENKHADADGFITNTLRMLGYTGDLPKDSVRRAELLSVALKQSRTLLLLDGIEPLQSLPRVNKGRLKDRGLQRLIQDLAIENPGLVVITSRQPLPELENRKAPKVVDVPLEALSPEAGVELLAHFGCRGSAADMRAAAQSVRGHALSLTLLGTYLSATEGGNVSGYDAVDFEKVVAESQEGDNVTAVLARQAAAIIGSYVNRFKALAEVSNGKGEAEALLLNCIGLFDRPAPGDAIEAILTADPIPGLTDGFANWSKPKRRERLREAKMRLRALKLLAGEDPNDRNAIDAHPIVRAHFTESFAKAHPDGFRQAHAVLEAHFAGQAPDQPDTLSEMEPLIHAMGHACAAGRARHALNELYWRRMQRENTLYIKRGLGAYSAELGALAHFYAEPWATPLSDIADPAAQSILLGQTAVSLRAMGRLREAQEALESAVVLDLARGHLSDAARVEYLLADITASMGDVETAAGIVDQSLEHARHAIDPAAMIDAFALRGEIAFLMGDMGQAMASFAEAEAVQTRTGATKYLFGKSGARLGNMLLRLGYADDNLQRAETNRHFADMHDQPMDHALAELMFARSLDLLEDTNPEGAYEVRAEDALGNAVDGLRQADYEDLLPMALVQRAKGLRKRAERTGDSARLARAMGDLAEAREIAERCELRLVLVEIAIEDARTALAGLPGGLTPDKRVLVDGTLDLSAGVPSSDRGWLSKLLRRRNDDKSPARDADAPRPEFVDRNHHTEIRLTVGQTEDVLLSTAERAISEAEQIVEDYGIAALAEEVQRLRTQISLVTLPV